MTPEKFFDYLEGKLAPEEKADLERALISDPELQREFFNARQIHRGLQQIESGESEAAAIAGRRGRQIAAAAAVLVALNVAIGLYFVFRSAQVRAPAQRAREEALRQQLQSSVEKSAAAAFPSPTIGIEQISITLPSARMDEAAKTIVDAAAKDGGSGTKGLPNDNSFSVLVIIPASAETRFRQTLSSLGAKNPSPRDESQTLPPNEPLRFEISLVAER